MISHNFTCNYYKIKKINIVNFIYIIDIYYCLMILFLFLLAELVWAPLECDSNILRPQMSSTIA